MFSASFCKSTGNCTFELAFLKKPFIYKKFNVFTIDVFNFRNLPLTFCYSNITKRVTLVDLLFMLWSFFACVLSEHMCI